jgi:hypothetical protein
VGSESRDSGRQLDLGGAGDPVVGHNGYRHPWYHSSMVYLPAQWRVLWALAVVVLLAQAASSRSVGLFFVALALGSSVLLLRFQK